MSQPAYFLTQVYHNWAAHVADCCTSRVKLTHAIYFSFPFYFVVFRFKGAGTRAVLKNKDGIIQHQVKFCRNLILFKWIFVLWTSEGHSIIFPRFITLNPFNSEIQISIIIANNHTFLSILVERILRFIWTVSHSLLSFFSRHLTCLTIWCININILMKRWSPLRAVIINIYLHARPTALASCFLKPLSNP